MNEPKCSGTKYCSSCAAVGKPATLHVLCFSVNRKALDGLYHICRTCQAAAGQKGKR